MMTKNSSLDDVLTEHRLWVETDGKQGRQLNLSGAFLQGACFAGADFDGADFMNASLIDARFSPKSLVDAGLIPEGDGLYRNRYLQTKWGIRDRNER